MTSPMLLSAIVATSAYALWRLLQRIYAHYTSPLRRLRGPKPTSWILGHLADVVNDESGALTQRWTETYGETLRYTWLFNKPYLFTTDTRAIHHILAHPDDYQKAPETKYALERVFGQGLVIVDGAQHRQQRRIMNPAFGPAQIRVFTKTFIDKSLRLRDLWSAEIAKDANTGGTRIDVVPWLSRATLDIIGLTGFGYDFNALDNWSGQPNPLSNAYATMFAASRRITVRDMLEGLIPALRYIPTPQSRRLRDAQRVMAEIGRGLLRNAKAAAHAKATENGEIEKNSLHGKDLLSLLVKANVATDIPQDQTLSDEDVIAQVPTFLVAGHETTSTSVAWVLYAISREPEVQTTLWKELLGVDTDTPTMDMLNALPYLDAVVRETLRVYPPVPGTLRTAMKDDVLLLDQPYTDRYGMTHNAIRITKGDRILISAREIQRSKRLWGADAHEFKPERWADVPAAVSQIPGIWGHLLTFSGGARACIGFRFSVVETKAIVFSLVRAFDFELAVPASDIVSRSGVLDGPGLRTDETREMQLPLLIRRR